MGDWLISYLLLAWNALFAPRKAVNQALLNVRPFWLGLGFVVLSSALVICVEFAAHWYFRKYEGALITWPTFEHIFSNPLYIGLLTSVIFLGSFFLMVLFWPLALPQGTAKKKIHAAIALVFALELVLAVPETFAYLVFEGNTFAEFAIIIINFIVRISLAAIFFSHATEISLTKAFWLNVLIGVINLLLWITLFFVVFLNEILGVINLSQESLT